MRKLALVSEHASPLAAAGGVDSGGQNIYVANVARHLASRGHQVDVFTRRDNPLLPRTLHWLNNVRVVHLDAGPPRQIPKEELLPLMPQFTADLCSFVAAESSPYDVVHANFFMSGLAGLALQERFGIPLVMTFHALGRVRRRFQREADRFPDERFAIEDDLVRRADRIVAECPQDLSDLVELYQADAQRIDIVPCGFDATEFAPMNRAAARRELAWEPDTFTVLQLGRLVERKGIDNVIRGVAQLARVHDQPVRLVVVGGNSADPNDVATPEIARLRAIAQIEGIEQCVEFAGRRPRDQLRLFYAAADVFVTTPWYEPFGITPVEAMACARPVIGAAVGGLQYTVHHGTTGYLVRPDDPEGLARALGNLARDPALGERMGLAGLRRAQRHFTWSHVVHGLLATYRRASGQPGAEVSTLRRSAATTARAAA